MVFVTIRKLPGTLSQNSSEGALLTDLAVEASPGSWVRGIPPAVFFHFSMLEDIGACFFLMGFNGTHPAQMGHDL